MYEIVTRELPLCHCVPVLVSASFLCLTCCHGAVAACCASCFFDVDPCWRDAEPHSLPLPRRWSPAVGSALSLDVQEVQLQHIVTKNNRSSNYGDGSGGGGGDEGTSSNICFGRQSPPFLAIGSLTLALALSDSVTLALFNTPLFLSRTLVYVTELCSARVTQSTFLRGVCTLVTRRRCPAWVSASPLQVDPHAFFFNL